jgi:hypothetical protein
MTSALEASRRRKLRELYAVTAYLSDTSPFLRPLNSDSTPDADEQRFLDANDISLYVISYKHFRNLFTPTR